MSTNSIIAVQQTDGTFTSVYCHWNGYPEYNGKILHEHYADIDKARQLVSHGDISVIKPDIGVKHSFRDTSTTTYYHRDRDEQWEDVKPVVLQSIADVEKRARDWGASYAYILQDGDEGWYVSCIWRGEYGKVTDYLGKEVEYGF